MSVFVIEDELYAEWIGEFASRSLAEDELQRIASLPYGRPPNLVPCASFATCRRKYCLIEFEAGEPEWKEVRRDHMLSVSASGAVWA